MKSGYYPSLGLTVAKYIKQNYARIEVGSDEILIAWVINGRMDYISVLFVEPLS